MLLFLEKQFITTCYGVLEKESTTCYEKTKVALSIKWVVIYAVFDFCILAKPSTINFL